MREFLDFVWLAGRLFQLFQVLAQKDCSFFLKVKLGGRGWVKSLQASLSVRYIRRCEPEQRIHTLECLIDDRGLAMRSLTTSTRSRALSEIFDGSRATTRTSLPAERRSLTTW